MKLFGGEGEITQRRDNTQWISMVGEGPAMSLLSPPAANILLPDEQ